MMVTKPYPVGPKHWTDKFADPEWPASAARARRIASAHDPRPSEPRVPEVIAPLATEPTAEPVRTDMDDAAAQAAAALGVDLSGLPTRSHTLDVYTPDPYHAGPSPLVTPQDVADARARRVRADKDARNRRDRMARLAVREARERAGETSFRGRRPTV